MTRCSSVAGYKYRVSRLNVNKFTMFRCALVVCALSFAAADARGTKGYNLVQSFDEKPIAESTEAPREEPVPVNERFPSAVLFGRTCGGTILSEKWVLSAAHCMLFTGGRDVLAGTNYTGDGSGVRRQVKKLHVHPLFTVGPYWLDAERYGFKQIAARWDFLLAELQEPLPLDGKTIVAAKLDGDAILPAGTPVGYGGYGAEHHGETMRHEMHGMSMATVDDQTCAKQLEQYNPEDMICTQGLPPHYDSACNGDSGSGLVTKDNRLVGVASWVENDAFECRNGAKVIFSRVSAARKWINKITGL